MKNSCKTCRSLNLLHCPVTAQDLGYFTCCRVSTINSTATSEATDCDPERPFGGLGCAHLGLLKIRLTPSTLILRKYGSIVYEDFQYQ